MSFFRILSIVFAIVPIWGLSSAAWLNDLPKMIIIGLFAAGIVSCLANNSLTPTFFLMAGIAELLVWIRVDQIARFGLGVFSFTTLIGVFIGFAPLAFYYLDKAEATSSEDAKGQTSE